MSGIVILTGAGNSAESGLGTFRDADGLWTKYDLEEVATPEGFARNPALVHGFYNARRQNCATAAPNAAHVALARLEVEYAGEVLVVTQNIDDLHERAGSRAVWHMHGELARALCAACGHRWKAPMVMAPGDACPACGAVATRPDVVWFGEMPYFLEDIQAALEAADLFVSISFELPPCTASPLPVLSIRKLPEPVDESLIPKRFPCIAGSVTVPTGPSNSSTKEAGPGAVEEASRVTLPASSTAKSSVISPVFWFASGEPLKE